MLSLLWLGPPGLGVAPAPPAAPSPIARPPAPFLSAPAARRVHQMGERRVPGRGHMGLVVRRA
eukprot:7485494-Alexandrium_andersonii.AAC.2